MSIDSFFDAAARARVEAAVKAAELKTSGQIVPVVVEHSANYHAFEVTLGLAASAALLATAVGALIEPGRAAPLGVALLTLAVGLSLWSPLSRLLVRHEFAEAVRRRALVAFVEHDLTQARDHSGVLVFASIYERQVVVFGDRGVHEKLGEARWQEGRDLLLAGIRRGDPADGFCQAIARLGEEMARVFPRGADSAGNELPDQLHVEPA